MKKTIPLLLSAALVAGMAGCSTPTTASQQEQAAESSAATEVEGLDLTFTDRDRDPSYDEASATRIVLDGETIAVEGTGAAAEGSTVTVSADGTYIVSGSLSDGQILVDLPGENDKAQIVLDGATIHNESGPALYVRQADKVFVTLADGSTNALSDGATYDPTDDGNDPKAALYSKDDLVINGSGALEVTGSYYHGIASTNDLKVTGGRIAVTSVQDAFHGKDCIKIGGGEIAVNAGDDAFHSEELFYIEAGTVNVEACVEGYEAEKVIISGGDSTIVASDDGVNAALAEDDEENASADGAADAQVATDEPPALPDDGTMPQAPDGAQPPEGADGTGMRGQKAERTFPDGELPQDGEMPQDGMARRGGRPDGTGNEDEAFAGRFDGEMPESAEGEQLQGGRGGMAGGKGGMQGAMSGVSEECLIRIDGGTLRVDAGGDGLDSNGSIEINGGTVLVSGASNAADTGLDYEFEATVNGGNVIIVGAAGMAEDFTGGSQAHLAQRVSGAAGATVEVTDAAGNVLVSYTVPKAFQMVNASAPGCTAVNVR